MEKSPEERRKRFADSGFGVQENEHTIEMDRETLDEGPPSSTNDSAVHETDGTRKTEIYRNDYERALPGHYKLIRMIGRGGMSEVFLAEDERLGRNVAIKFLNSEFRRDPDRMRRFNREARAASALNHPNILTIHDIGENDGVQFIVSEFIDGETLGTRIAKGRFPLAEAVRISIDIASALSASHNAGIVHRDIKPDNVMIRRDGSVKVLDFGLAKGTGGIVFDSNGTEAQTLETAATSPGLILGTPQYMSPEQARGRQLDARTDIFSFGVILFEMVTGKQPFPGSSLVDIIAAVIGNDPLPIKQYLDDPPELLVRIVTKALRKNKDERYETMGHLLSDLRDLNREVAELPYVNRSTVDDKARETRPNTIRSFLGESPLNRRLTLLFLLGIPAVALAAWWISTSPTAPDRSTAAGSMKMVPITNWSGSSGELVSAAAFSPDSRLIAFSATKTGSTEIWTKPVSGGEPIQVTKNGQYNQYPIWSPNGQELAFFSRRGGERGIWRVSFTGGQQSQITSGTSALTRPILWSPKGVIYFQDGPELFAADEKTGAISRITDLAGKRISPRAIALSDDESRIAFSTREGGGWKVKIADLNGASVSEIGSSSEQIDHLAWDPDGRSVVYSCSVNGAYQVFRSSPGETEPTQLSNGNLDVFVQDVSVGGTGILYSSVNETSDIWRVDVSGSSQIALANDVATEFWADVSPDGGNIVFQSVNQADRPFRGSIKLASTTVPGASVSLAAEGFAPAWSPDGRYAAFFRRSDSSIAIWRVGADGGSSLKLADGLISPPGYLVTPYLKIGTGHIGWAPDGKRIAYVAKTGNISNIWLASTDGTNDSGLTRNDDESESFCCSVWTADGANLIVSSERIVPDAPRRKHYRLWSVSVPSGEQKLLYESASEIRLLGISGGELVFTERADATEATPVSKAVRIFTRPMNSSQNSSVVTLNNTYFHNTHLSRDGRSVAYVARVDDISTLWTVPTRGGQPRKLAEENDGKILISSLAWSPDGGSIILAKQTRTNLLSMLSK